MKENIIQSENIFPKKNRMIQNRQPLTPRPVAKIEGWEPNEVTWQMWVVAGLQFAVSIALLWQAYQDLDINILNSTAVFLTTVAGWIFADFLSGRFHKYIDAYGDENTPIVGTVIKEFAHHHRRPKDALCTPLLAALWGEVRFTAPLTILLMWVPMHPLLRIFAVTALAGIALSQHSHNLAHIPLKKRSTSLKIVQVLRIFLRHRPHMIHHRPPHSEYFEPLNGVCSPILERLNDNRREECLFWYLFHAVPRTWEDPKLAPPSYLDETMHHASGMARFKFDQQFLNNSENQNHLGTQRPKERIK